VDTKKLPRPTTTSHRPPDSASTVAYLALAPDGASLALHRHVERTAAEIRHFAPKDAVAYLRLIEDLRPADFDLDVELELLRADLREQFPGYDNARELSVAVCAGEDWPAQRAIAGHDLERTTPIANLWNVGDGVRAWTGAGQSGCVETARLVVDQIRRHCPPSLHEGNPT
jgi:phytoene dehydrogenase-like protein